MSETCCIYKQKSDQAPLDLLINNPQNNQRELYSTQTFSLLCQMNK